MVISRQMIANNLSSEDSSVFSERPTGRLNLPQLSDGKNHVSARYFADEQISSRRLAYRFQDRHGNERQLPASRHIASACALRLEGSQD